VWSKYNKIIFKNNSKFCCNFHFNQVELVCCLKILLKWRLAMKKFEYKCAFILGMGNKTTKELNIYGQDGWELVTTYWAWHYFKRPSE